MGLHGLQENILYKHLFMRANDAIILYNGRDNIIDVNMKACELFGYSREEMLTLSLADLKKPDWSGKRRGGQV